MDKIKPVIVKASSKALEKLRPEDMQKCWEKIDILKCWDSEFQVY